MGVQTLQTLAIRPPKPIVKQWVSKFLQISSRFPSETSEMTLTPGDTIALHTDGVIEVRDEDGIEYGIAAWKRIFDWSKARRLTEKR